MTEPDLHIVPDAGAMVAPAVTWIERAIDECLRARGRCSVALSGGSTPKAVLAALSERPIEWDWLDFYFVDERCVPAGDPDSNFRMANDVLFRPAQVDAKHVHRMRGEDVPEQAAEAYAQLLPERLDIALYGIGEDGHTASLFPGSALLLDGERAVSAVHGSPKPPPDRLTIMPKVIERARRGLVLANGAGKADAVARALEDGPVQEVPARLLRGCTWILDSQAAARLRRNDKS